MGGSAATITSSRRVKGVLTASHLTQLEMVFRPLSAARHRAFTTHDCHDRRPAIGNGFSSPRDCLCPLAASFRAAFVTMCLFP
jgi:hypothetical protein